MSVLAPLQRREHPMSFGVEMARKILYIYSVNCGIGECDGVRPIVLMAGAPTSRGGMRLTMRR